MKVYRLLTRLGYELTGWLFLHSAVDTAKELNWHLPRYTKIKQLQIFSFYFRVPSSSACFARSHLLFQNMRLPDEIKF